MTFNISNPIGIGTDEELLEFTRAAIAQLTLGGEEVEIRGRRVKRSELPALWDQVERLEARIAAAAGTSTTNYAQFKRPL